MTASRKVQVRGWDADTCAGTCRRPGTTERSGSERASGVRASPARLVVRLVVRSEETAVRSGAVERAIADHLGRGRRGGEGPRRGDVRDRAAGQRGRERTAEGPAGTDVPVKRPVLAGLSPLCTALTSSGSPITTLPRRG